MFNEDSLTRVATRLCVLKGWNPEDKRSTALVDTRVGLPKCLVCTRLGQAKDLIRDYCLIQIALNVEGALEWEGEILSEKKEEQDEKNVPA